jgi:hypothetical protein
LKLYRVPPLDFSESTNLAPGVYEVVKVGDIGGKPWLRLKDADWGNAAECWMAVSPGFKTGAERLERLSKKAALLIAALLWACVLVKTDCVEELAPPELPMASGLMPALVQHYIQGQAFTAHQLRNGEIRVFRYASSGAIVRELLEPNLRSGLPAEYLLQVHKDIFLVILVMALACSNTWFIANSLKFIFPLLLIGNWRVPADPVLDLSPAFYYVALAVAVAALIWNDLLADASGTFWRRVLAHFLSLMALFYNGVLLLIVLRLLRLG